MTDKVNKRVYQYLSLWHVLLIITLAVVAFVIIDQYAYVDKLKERYRVQSLQFSMSCQGDAKWLSNAANEVISQNQRDSITNISMSYVSPSGAHSSCITGTTNQQNESFKVKKSTVYQLASVTKTFTADTILYLIREGRLNLDDKLVDILPELQDITYQDNRVTDIQVEHLLSHTAGFDRSVPGVLDDIFQSNPWCPKHVEQLSSIELQFAPDERMAYSNTGYCLLSRIIEEKYQQPYRDVVRQRYQLKDYKNFDFISDTGEIPIINSAIEPLTEPLNYKSLSAAAGLYGSATDLAALVYAMELIEHPNIIDHASNSLCNTTIIRGCHGYMGYEYSTDPRLSFYWRSGDMNNVSALIIVDNEGGVMSMLTNARIRSYGITHLINYVYQYRLLHDL